MAILSSKIAQADDPIYQEGLTLTFYPKLSESMKGMLESQRMQKQAESQQGNTQSQKTQSIQKAQITDENL